MVQSGNTVLSLFGYSDFIVLSEPEKKRYIKFDPPPLLYTVVPLATLMEKLEAPALYIWDCDNAGQFLSHYSSYNNKLYTYLLVLLFHTIGMMFHENFYYSISPGLIVQRFNEIAREKKEGWRNNCRDAPEPRFEEDCLHLAACGKDQVCLHAYRRGN